ncbi:hypothetical protein KC851_04215 [Candidatus Kaiserbacteria bacterium]|nr:hypothetical protein [Candidatus Kaiserbacteria bacterium]
MSRNRGHRHTTKTETAKEVVTVLKRFPDIKMIAPGEIDPKNRSTCSRKFITMVHTTAGCELIISGQGSQKISVHTNNSSGLFTFLKNHKKLRGFEFKERERKPEV